MRKLALALTFGALALALPLVVLAYSGSAWGAETAGLRKEHRDEAKEPRRTETRRDKANPLRGCSKGTGKIRFRVTAYCMPAKGRPRGVNGPDGTSSGAPLRIGVAAADPRRIPFGTEITVPGFGTVTVLDTIGKSVTGKWKPGRPLDLDIFVGHGREARKFARDWGVRHLVAEIRIPAGKNYVLAQE